MRLTRTILILLALFLIHNVALGEIYKWTDENGIRHYTNIDPPENAILLEEPWEKNKRAFQIDSRTVLEGYIKNESCWVVTGPSVMVEPVGYIKLGASVSVVQEGPEWLQIVLAAVREKIDGTYIDCQGCYIQRHYFTNNRQ